MFSKCYFEMFSHFQINSYLSQCPLLEFPSPITACILSAYLFKEENNLNSDNSYFLYHSHGQHTHYTSPMEFTG